MNISGFLKFILALHLSFAQFVPTIPANHGATGSAIAHDADSGAVACGNNATCTVSLTVGATAHNFVWLTGGCDTGSSGCTISSVVDSTNSATLTCAQANDTTDFRRNFACYTTGVPSGANSFLITLTGAPGTTAFEAQATSYTGVNQSTPFDVGPTAFTTMATATSFSESITTTVANDWIVDTAMAGDSNGGTISGTSPQVTRWHVLVNTSFHIGASDNGPIVTPAATNDGWTYSASTPWYTAIIGAIKPG